MPKLHIIVPLVGFSVIGGASLHAANTWGPVEPDYRLVLHYRTDALVIDHGLTASECSDALPFGDELKHVHFACEREV